MGEGLLGRVRYCVCEEHQQKKEVKRKESRKEAEEEEEAEMQAGHIQSLFITRRICRGDGQELQQRKSEMHLMYLSLLK